MKYSKLFVLAFPFHLPAFRIASFLMGKGMFAQESKH
jgi:hypothetical protein